MARQLEEINSSGELISVKVGGAGAEKEVTLKETTDTLAARVTVNETDITTNATNIGTNDTDIAALQSGKLDNTVAQFTPQTDPGIGEGQVFYDSGKHALSVVSDVDMILNIGQEEIIRVFNNTGSSIPDGKPVYITGAANGLPTVGLAQANLVSTASVPGITTHEILNGEEGFITHAGSLGGDFSAFAIGDKLYLSETVAGGFVTVAPDYATSLGLVTDNAVDGKLVVKINSLIALPTLIGVLNDGEINVTTIGATYAPVDAYLDEYAVGVTTDALNGRITVPTVGLYRLNINFNIAFTDTGNNTAVVDLQLWNVTQAAEALVISSSIAKNSEGCALSPNFVHDFIVPDEVFELRVRSTGTDLTGVTYRLVTFDLESVHLRA